MLAETIAIVVFAGVLVTALLLYGSVARHRTAEALELERRIGPGELPPRLIRLREADAVGRALGPVGRWVHALTVQAGGEWEVGTVVLSMLVAAGSGVALLGWLLGMPQAIAGLLLGAAPLLWLRHRARQRARQLTEQLPDALDLIARALRSGHAFAESLRMAAAELPSPIRDELGPVAEEHRLGISLRDCLHGLLGRVPHSFEMRLFASSILLHRETGGNLIEILEQLADTIRERVVFEQKAHAMTAEVRTSAAILEALPFLAAALITFVSPTYLLPLLDPGFGRVLLVTAAVSMSVGVVLMRRIAHVEA